MTEEKYTATPYKWSPKISTENRSMSGNEKHKNSHGEAIPIVYLHEGWRSEKEKQATMDFIETACNFHAQDQKTIDALVKACKVARIALKDLRGSSAILATQDIDNVLLALAKEKPCKP